LYEAILPLLSNTSLCPAPVSLTLAEARRKMQEGLPLLHSLDLELSAEAVHKLMTDLARAIENIWDKKVSSESRDAIRLVRVALEENTLDVSRLLPLVTAGEGDALASAAHTLQIDPWLVRTLLQSALKPALRAWCRQLAPLAEGIPWNKGSCFICGAQAVLGELQGNNLIKHLRCGECGADWVVRRLQCTYCGNEDHKTLGYFSPKGQSGNARVEVCDKCKGYLKVIPSFTPMSAEMLAVEDLATLHLDCIARERGYARVVAG
ncbi:MAG TPA: formate dehydrogenase accessory protein FdhE, partial [Thermodesulfovibrionales bacterium]|nr:formate dehydrogenase accessory protein FdhE [Thermodesulfovibrionales bacterium]